MKKILSTIFFALIAFRAIAASVTITWDASPSPGPIVYILYSSVNGNPFVFSGSSAATTITVSATMLTSYYVTASNTDGESDPSNTVVYTPPSTPPAPPTNLRATAMSATRIDLQWTPSADLLVVYTLIDRDGTTIATLPAGQGAYIDNNLRKNRAYRYSVRAQDSLGLVSAYSNTATAVTLKH